MALAEMIQPEILVQEKPQSNGKKKTGETDYYIDFDLSWHPSLPGIIDRLIEWTGYCTSTSQYRPGRCMVLAGESGSGKTHLAKMVKRESGLYCTMIEEDKLFERLRSAYGRKANIEEIFNQYRRANVLIYDDLGTDKGNREWLDSTYYKLFGTQQAFLITTNLKKPEFIKRVGDRVASRLKQAMGGKDGIKRHFIDMWGIPDYRGK